MLPGPGSTQQGEGSEDVMATALAFSASVNSNLREDMTIGGFNSQEHGLVFITLLFDTQVLIQMEQQGTLIMGQPERWQMQN